MPPPSRPQQMPPPAQEPAQGPSKAPNAPPAASGDPNNADGPGGQQSGLLGRLFGFSLRRNKNEVHLPDDKNPAIVWDPQKGRWLTAGASEEEEVVTAPPPTMTQVGGAGENRFRSGGIGGRGAANRYVDVFAASAAPPGRNVTAQPPRLPQPPGPKDAAATNPLMPPMPVAAQPQFFVPAPVPPQ